MHLLAHMAHSLGFEWFNHWHHNTADQVWGEETWRTKDLAPQTDQPPV